MQSPIPLTPTLLLLCPLLQSLPTVTSTCTSFTDASIRIGGPAKVSFSVEGYTVLDSIICPLDSKAPCSLPPKTYDITVPRALNLTTVSREEEDAIFEIARESYNEKTAALNEPAVREFVNITGTVTSLDAPETLRTTEPGMNYTLYWAAHMYYGTGMLGGCSDTKLNGVYVKYTAAYEQTSNVTNQTVLAGKFDGSAQNMSEVVDDGANKSAGGRMGVGFGRLAGLLALSGLTWVL